MSISGTGSAMEQGRYWMWMKRKNILKPHIQASMNSFNDSWEEQAFAEDAAGPLGGCIWPPRSYSCNFCKREFRSAQALGGHMNVHRRDRARLKQSLSPQNHDQNSCKSLGPQYPSQVCTIDYYNRDPNCSPSFVASPLSPSRSDSKTEVAKSSRIEESECQGQNDYVETDLSLGVNLVLSRNRPTGSSNDELISCKRQKSSTSVSSLPFFLKLRLHSDVHGLKTSSMEELDLELRLGNPPKVK